MIRRWRLRRKIRKNIAEALAIFDYPVIDDDWPF